MEDSSEAWLTKIFEMSWCPRLVASLAEDFWNRWDEGVVLWQLTLVKLCFSQARGV